MSQQQLERIRNMKKNPLPTPDIGWWVHWFEKNEDSMCVPALVTQVLGPGKLMLEIHKPRHVPIHRTGVLHRSDPIHEQRAHPATIAAGSWDYIPHAQIPQEHYNLHLEELKRQESAFMRQIEDQERIKVAMKEKAELWHSPASYEVETQEMQDRPRRGRPPKQANTLPSASQ